MIVKELQNELSNWNPELQIILQDEFAGWEADIGIIGLLEVGKKKYISIGIGDQLK